MALVQSLPVSIDPRLHPASPPLMGAMGAVSSMIPNHVSYPERANIEVSTNFRKGTPGSGRLLSDASQVGSRTPSSKRRGIVGRAKGFGTRSYSHEDLIRDWNDNHHLNVGMTAVDGPPKLVPVSGQLERNIQQAIIRPTAFKPVIPKSRSTAQYLSPRLGAGLSGSQGNLSMFSPDDEDVSTGTMERRSSYSGARNALFSQSFTMTDTARSSLTNLPAYTGPVFNQSQSEISKHHGHSNSDSGRSSSSKSTGSLGGRGQMLSDMGSAGPSPPPIEAYEAIVRDLEEKLRERDLELQTLRENLDENEAAICQVYEERHKRTELEIEEFRQMCAAKMHKASQKAQREQQLLQLQVFQMQQEKKKLQEDMTQILKERQRLEERCASYEREHTQLGPRLEETKWEVCQKSGEISLLKQQLKDLQADVAQRVGELVTVRGQLREVRSELQTCQNQLQEAHTASRTRTLELEVCENELQRRKSENELLRDKMSRLEESSSQLREALTAASGEEQRLASESGEQVDRLKAELVYERQRFSDQAAAFEGERKSWEEEKEKVIHYQKQLQQNYVQMYKRNRDLERSLRELSLELESREQDDDSSGNEVTFDDIAATEI